MTGYTLTAFQTMSALIPIFLDSVLDAVIWMVCCLIHSIPMTLPLGSCYYTWRYGILSAFDTVVFWTLIVWEDLAVTICYWAVWWYIVFSVSLLGLRFFVDRQPIITALATRLNSEYDWHLFPYLVAISYPVLWDRPLSLIGRKLVESWTWISWPWIWYFSKGFGFFLFMIYVFYVWKFHSREGQPYRRAFVTAVSNGLVNEIFAFLVVLINIFLEIHPSIDRLVTRWRARITRWQHYFNGRVPGPFQALPTEIKLQIAALAMDLNDETDVLPNLLFNILPALHHREPYLRWYALEPFRSMLEYFHAQLQGQVFAPSINTMIPIRFRTLHTLIRREYALSQLFPNGVIPQDPYNAGDTHAQWTAFSLETNLRDPNRYSSYYYFWYLNFSQNRAYTLLDAIHALTGQAPTTQRFRTLIYLFIFLGSKPNNGLNNAQRYDYLSTLTRQQITDINSLLDEIALAIATRYRDTPPPENSAYSKIYHNGDNLSFGIHDCIQMLPPSLPWRTFTRTGAYESCLKSWLLTLSSLSFYHFFVLDEPRRDGNPLPFWDPVWKKEWASRRTQLFVAVIADPLDAGNDEVECWASWNPNLAADRSMELFATVNPLYMWKEVMRKVEQRERERVGQAGDDERWEGMVIAGRDNESGVQGERVAWSVPMRRNLHPEWDIAGWRERGREPYATPVRLARWAGSVVDL